MWCIHTVVNAQDSEFERRKSNANNSAEIYSSNDDRSFVLLESNRSFNATMPRNQD